MHDKNSNPFVLIEYYFPKEGKEEAILEIAERSLNFIKNRPSVLMAYVLKAKSNKDPICNLTFYNTKENFNELLKTADFQDLLKSEDMANVQNWTTDIQVKMFSTYDGWHL